MLRLQFLSLFASLALAASRTTAPSGALVVGGEGSYSAIQEAVDALDSSTSSEQIIFINPGTYTEQVYIQQLSGPLTVYGYTEDDGSYGSNQVEVTGSKSQADGLDNDGTATMRVWTTNFKMYNVNLVNTYGEGSQALAVSAQAESQGYYACQFVGFQDTVLANTGAQLYAKSYIEGNTDFIFGQFGSAWFEQCDIRIPSTNLSYITASGRESDDSGYYVINNSTIAAADGASVAAGAVYLGRPWGNYARVAVQETDLSEIINSAGWSVWNEGDERIDAVSFGEYGNTGAGSEGTRASFASQLSAPLAMADVLGSGYESAAWFDADFLSGTSSSTDPVASAAPSSVGASSIAAPVSSAPAPASSANPVFSVAPISSAAPIFSATLASSAAAASSAAPVFSGNPVFSSPPIISQPVAVDPPTSTIWVC